MIVGAVVLIVSLVVYSFYGTESVMPQQTIQEENPDQDILDEAFLLSTVETDRIFTESDQTVIEQFLDEQGIGFTEKFGIITNIAVFDSDQNVETESSAFGIAQDPLSVTDNTGRLLDLGSIQVTMQGVAKQKETHINVWGTVDFFLDDNKVDSKNIWASQSNTNEVDLSIVDSLQFEYKPNPTQSIEVATQQALITNLKAEIDRKVKNQSNTGRFVPDPSLPAMHEQMKVEVAKLNAMESTFGSEIKRALPPSFSQQDKKNQTFTLSDEGRDWEDGSEHAYRIVLTEVHAELLSDKQRKEFNWNGQEVLYRLDVKVNGAKKVILDEDNKAIEIFKSDNTLKLCGKSIYQHPSHPINPFTQTNNPPNVVVKDIAGNILVDASYSVGRNNANDSSCRVFEGIPRGAELFFIVDGVEYTVTTPEHQQNYFIDATLEDPKQGCQTQTTSWRTFKSCANYYQHNDYSNFGYGLSR